MLQYVLLTAALVSGQPAPASPGLANETAPQPRLDDLSASADGSLSLPLGFAPELPVAGELPSPGSEILSGLRPASFFAQQPTAETPPPAEPLTIAAPFLTAAVRPIAVKELASTGIAVVPDRWWLMREMQGAWLGALLDGNRMSISGWTEMAYTASTARVSNVPVTWNDRANQFLLHQNVVRLDRAIVPTSTTEPTWGYRVDALVGSDYRYTVARGLFDSQLVNSTGAQNLYGVDLLTFYANVYLPTFFRGTEIAIGRFLTPVSSESEETILTPLLTRSMSFNSGGPFTHTGLSVTSKLTPQFTARAILALGNDVFIDPSAELRGVGSLVWTSLDAKDILTFNTTVGRGKFNADAPFAPATSGTVQEPAGRNNINVFDFIWAHVLTPRFTYQLELETGYQYGVPTTAAVGPIAGAIISDSSTEGTAHWASAVQYFFYKWTPKFMTITRLEAFDDINGQRTGFKGLYTEATTGLQYHITKAVVFRPELRYDYNGFSRPFEDKHDIFTMAFDMIVRW